MKAANWIDRVKTSKGLPSDYAVAQLLGITRSSVSKYRSSTPTFDEEMSVKIARVLEIPPGVVLADQAMERAKNEEARSAWSQILERLGGVAASVMLTAGMLAGFGYSPDAQSATSSGKDSNSTVSKIYIV